MAFDWTDFIRRHREGIIEEWARRLHTEVNQRYAERPIEELYGTVGRALDANCSAIIEGDHTLINRFINKISRVRLAGGFSINDVLMAFELFRTVILARLNRETTREELYQCFIQVNELLTYTHLCFIEFFQELHRQEMVDYTRRLEEDVKVRTSELAESERKYKTLIEEINDGYVILQNGEIVFVNRAFCEMHGASAGDLLGKQFDELVDARDRKDVSELCLGGDPGRVSVSPLEYHRVMHSSGKSLPTEITVKSTCYGSNRCTIGICRDITERVTMAAKIRDAERMAYIGRITTSLSHEIRNPLSAMKMNLQILRRNLSLEGNDRRRMEISLREMQRLEGILEQLLDFAKPLLLKRSPCDLNRFIPACVELLESRFEEHHLSVNLHLDPTVPEISADPGKLERAIVNLLINALEATEPRGQIDVHSGLDTTGPDPRIEFRVENQGNIPDEVLPDVFKPFFTTKAKGTGLGLTNVKRVVEAHGGSVSVEQKHRNRTVVRVSLPVGDVHG